MYLHILIYILSNTLINLDENILSSKLLILCCLLGIEQQCIKQTFLGLVMILLITGKNDNLFNIFSFSSRIVFILLDHKSSLIDCFIFDKIFQNHLWAIIQKHLYLYNQLH